MFYVCSSLSLSLSLCRPQVCDSLTRAALDLCDSRRVFPGDVSKSPLCA